MKYIVIFCKPHAIPKISTGILLGICDFVSVRTSHNRTVFEILDKDIFIDIRLDIIEKAGGLRPTHVFLDQSCDYEFCEAWKYNMGGRYTKLNSLDDVIKLVIEKED